MNYNLSDQNAVVILLTLQNKETFESHYGLLTIPDFEQADITEIMDTQFSDYNILSYVINPLSSMIPSAYVNYSYRNKTGIQTPSIIIH